MQDPVSAGRGPSAGPGRGPSAAPGRGPSAGPGRGLESAGRGFMGRGTGAGGQRVPRDAGSHQGTCSASHLSVNGPPLSPTLGIASGGPRGRLRANPGPPAASPATGPCPPDQHRLRPARLPHAMCDGAWRPLWALAALWLAGCSVRPLKGGGGGDAGGTGTTIAGGASTGEVAVSTGSVGPMPTTGGVTGELPAGTSTGPDIVGSSGLDTGGVEPCEFICELDLPDQSDDCPGTQQLDPECPDGQKCTIDGSFSESHCVDIVPNPKGLYEPCMLLGDGLSGLDDCGLGMFCWDLDDRGEGRCIGLCDGLSFENCECADPKVKFPTICQDCAVGVCIPGCDPLLPDCPGDDLCIQNGEGFICVLDASGEEGQVNDPCEFVNACDKGLVCSDTATASSVCDPQISGCCQPFCHFPDGACPNPDQACVQIFDPAVEPDFKDIGVCAIPP